MTSMLTLEGDEEGVPRILEQELPAQFEHVRGSRFRPVAALSDRVVVVEAADTKHEATGDIEPAPSEMTPRRRELLERWVFVLQNRGAEGGWQRKIIWPERVSVERGFPRELPVKRAVKVIRAVSVAGR